MEAEYVTSVITVAVISPESMGRLGQIESIFEWEKFSVVAGLPVIVSQKQVREFFAEDLNHPAEEMLESWAGKEACVYALLRYEPDRSAKMCLENVIGGRQFTDVGIERVGTGGRAYRSKVLTRSDYMEIMAGVFAGSKQGVKKDVATWFGPMHVQAIMRKAESFFEERRSKV